MLQLDDDVIKFFTLSMLPVESDVSLLNISVGKAFFRTYVKLPTFSF